MTGWRVRAVDDTGIARRRQLAANTSKLVSCRASDASTDWNIGRHLSLTIQHDRIGKLSDVWVACS